VIHGRIDDIDEFTIRYVVHVLVECLRKVVCHFSSVIFLLIFFGIMDIPREKC